MNEKVSFEYTLTSCGTDLKKDMSDLLKPSLSLTLTPSTPFKNIFTDGTPTPTRFLNALNSEEFEELNCDNPFDAAYRNANTSGSSFHLPLEPVQSADTEVLNTPSIPVRLSDPPIERRKTPPPPKTRSNVITSVGSVSKPPCGVPTAVVVARPNLNNTTAEKVAPPKNTTPVKPQQPAVVQSVTVTPMVQLILRLPDGQTMPVQFPMATTNQPTNILPATQQNTAKQKLKETLTNNQRSLKPNRRRRNSDSPPLSPLASTRRNVSPGGPEDKRIRSLERNRAAATRCREKRKQWITSLERKADELACVNIQLNHEVSQLRQEVAQLKTMLLAHKDCPVTQMQQQQKQHWQDGDVVVVEDPSDSVEDSSLSEASYKEFKEER